MAPAMLVAPTSGTASVGNGERWSPRGVSGQRAGSWSCSTPTSRSTRDSVPENHQL